MDLQYHLKFPWIIKQNTFIDTIKNFLKDLFFFIFLISFILNVGQIPSSSMASKTLLVGDFILVSKPFFHITINSLPYFLHNFIPQYWRNFKITFNQLQRGEPCAFRIPGNEDIIFMKRIIGLEGDKIEIKNNCVYLNNQLLRKTYDYEDKKAFFFMEQIPLISNINPFLYKHKTKYKKYSVKIKKIIPDKFKIHKENTEVFYIPKGFVFLMGDNRDNSDDARFNVGLIPIENIIGKPIVILLSFPKDITLITLVSPTLFFKNLASILFNMRFSRTLQVIE